MAKEDQQAPKPLTRVVVVYRTAVDDLLRSLPIRLVTCASFIAAKTEPENADSHWDIIKNRVGFTGVHSQTDMISRLEHDLAPDVPVTPVEQLTAPITTLPEAIVAVLASAQSVASLPADVLSRLRYEVDNVPDTFAVISNEEATFDTIMHGTYSECLAWNAGFEYASGWINPQTFETAEDAQEYVNESGVEHADDFEGEPE